MGVGDTYSGAAHKDNGEGPQHPSNADQPGHSQEQDHPKDILQARQVDAHQGAHSWSLGDKQRQSLWILSIRTLSTHESLTIKYTGVSNQELNRVKDQKGFLVATEN